MKILHLNENYQIKGGTETYIHRLQIELVKYSINSDFYSVSNDFFRYKIEGANGFEKCFEGISNFLIYFESFIKLNSYTIIHIHNISDTAVLTKCFELLPVIRSFHDQRLFCPGNQKFFIKNEIICNKAFGLACICNGFKQRCMSIRPHKMVEQYRRVQFDLHNYRRYHSIIVASEYMKNEAVLIGYSPDYISVVPYFTRDLVLFDQVSGETNELKSILFVGRLHQSKGIHLLIESMKLVFEQIDDVHLNIVGDGDFRSVLEQIIRTLNIEQNKITFHGWLDLNNVYQLMRASKFVVFPSIYPEAFGIVGIEAMSLSKPVIAFNVGGVGDWLINEESGLLLDSVNVPDLAAAIIRLLIDDDLRHSLSQSSRYFFESKFTADIHLKKLLQLYFSAEEYHT
jgi:glycosyltransferase involved in cell wall biosynthesis